MEDSFEMETTLELLADRYAREIINRLNDAPASAPELAQRCSCSRTTVYRRLDQLDAAGLVSVTLELRRDGNHRRVYENAVEELTFSVSDQGVTGHIRNTAQTV